MLQWAVAVTWDEEVRLLTSLFCQADPPWQVFGYLFGLFVLKPGSRGERKKKNEGCTLLHFKTPQILKDEIRRKTSFAVSMSEVSLL